MSTKHRAQMSLAGVSRVHYVWPLSRVVISYRSRSPCPVSLMWSAADGQLRSCERPASVTGPSSNAGLSGLTGTTGARAASNLKQPGSGLRKMFSSASKWSHNNNKRSNLCHVPPDICHYHGDCYQTFVLTFACIHPCVTELRHFSRS